MPDRTTRSIYLLTTVLLGACAQRAPSTGPAAAPETQGAASSALRQIRRLPGVAEPVPVAAGAAAIEMPSRRVVREGDLPMLEVDADADHVKPMAVHAAQGWALTWTDGEHAHVYVGRTNEIGQPAGAVTVAYSAHGDEEEIWSPSLAASDAGFGLAWADPANGRVRFAKLDPAGHIQGHASIVHDGLEMPMLSRLAWNGHEYGVAVGLDNGMYFTRIGTEGARVGGGQIVSEGVAPGTLDELAVNGDGFELVWHDGDEHASRRSVQLDAAGRVRASRDGHAEHRVATR